MKLKGNTHSLPGSGPLTVVQPVGGGGGGGEEGGGGGGGGGPGVLGHSLDPVVESIQLLTAETSRLVNDSIDFICLG